MGGSASQSDDARARKVCCACSSDEKSRLLDVSDDTDPPDDENTQDLSSIIQFSCTIYFCREDEGCAQLDVVRLGDATLPASVQYTTVEASAKAGQKYFHKQGTVNFNPGETVQSIEVALINDESWDATLEFRVELRNARNAALGAYLKECRVKIIDDDAFPTNKYATNFQNNTEESIPNSGLFLEYFKMNMVNLPAVRWGSLQIIVCDQFKNLYMILCLTLQMYLVDVVLDKEDDESDGKGRLLLSFIQESARRLRGDDKDAELDDGLIVPGDRITTAIIVGAMYIVPFAFLHMIDFGKALSGVSGNSRLHLQANLMRKSLNYKEEHRERISVGDVTMCMVRDVPDVVNFGFMKVLEIFKILGSIGLAVMFILQHNAKALAPCCGLAVVMGTFAACRGQRTIDSCREMALRQNLFVHSANEAVNNYRLIADFALRPYVVDRYEERVKAFNLAARSASMVFCNNSYCPTWLTTVLVGSYMMIAPFQLKTFGGNLTLGTFLATLNIFKELGHLLTAVYMELMEIQRSVGSLRKVAHFMNLETDLELRMAMNRVRRREGEQERKKARASMGAVQRGKCITASGEELFAVDTIPVGFENVSFRYKGVPPIFKNADHKFDQGKLYAFVGPPHEGKGTFLKLMGGVLLPEFNGGAPEGSIFIPPHLRVLHLSETTYFLSGSLLENLVLSKSVDQLGGMDRINQICRRLHFPGRMLSQLYDDDSSDEAFIIWKSMLSHSDHPRINLARAFIMNPEFLVLHKPAIVFDDDEQGNVISLIRAHVDERGIELPAADRKFRRRRTVFFSSSTQRGIEASDAVYDISTAYGVRDIPKAAAMRAIPSSGSSRPPEPGAGSAREPTAKAVQPPRQNVR